MLRLRNSAAFGRRVGVAVVEDFGSGALVDLREYGLPHERTVQDAIADGMSLVAFSGDKLLGGPQAGIIVGTRPHVARLRSNPLVRALRVDKVTLALLGATLRLYANKESREQIPFYRMLAISTEALRERATRIAPQIAGAKLLKRKVASVAGRFRKPSFHRLGSRFRPLSPTALRRVCAGGRRRSLRVSRTSVWFSIFARSRRKMTARSFTH